MWRQVRREWRRDAIRRHHVSQVQEVRYAVTLGQADLWLAWDEEAPDKEWTGPRYCAGTVVTCVDPPALWVQFATGIRLQSWLPLAVKVLEQFAREQNLESLVLFCRRGWVRELNLLAWSLPVTIRRDPELLRVSPASNHTREAVSA
jgi:hypothetical protein